LVLNLSLRLSLEAWSLALGLETQSLGLGLKPGVFGLGLGCPGLDYVSGWVTLLIQ